MLLKISRPIVEKVSNPDNIPPYYYRYFKNGANDNQK